MIPTTERALVSIYRSSKRAEMYLYLSKKAGLGEVPAALMQQFGTPILVMDMLLKRDRKLARVNTGRVLDELVDKGFYLQMPPAREDYLSEMRRETHDSTKPDAL